MLSKLFQAIGLTGISLALLSGCSRDNDVIFPEDVPAKQVNSCSELVPNETLLNGLSLRKPSRHTSVAGIALDQPFDIDVFQYNASVGALTNVVRLFPNQVLTDSDGLIQSLTVNVKVDTTEQTLDTNLAYLQESPWIYLPPGETQIQLEVEAILNNRSVFVDCEPTLEQQASVITQSRTYLINIDRAPLSSLSHTTVGPDNLVEGTSLNAFIDGEKPLDALDQFGRSVAIYGDTLVIGVPGDDNGDPLYTGATTITDSNRLAFLQSLADDDNILTDSGAVYVFQRQAVGDWQLTHVLKPGYPDAGDRFGHAVAVYEDVIAVSAFYEDSASTGINGIEDNELAPDSGAVYVFRRQGSDWMQEAYIKAQSNVLGNDGYHDAFGDQLRLDGDQLLVSAPFDDINAADDGSVHLYEMDGSAWQYATSLSSSLAQSGDNFGSAIAIHEDLIAVGAPGDDSDLKVLTNADGIGELVTLFEDESPFLTIDSGAVHIFEKNNDSWAQQAYMKASNADAGDRFGSAVSLSGTTLYVGAPREDGSASGFNKNLGSNNLSNSGAVYQFFLFSEFGNWTFSNYIKGAPAMAGALFGRSIDSDYGVILVGAPKEITVPGEAQGRLYVLEETPLETRHWFMLRFYDDNESTALENAFRSLSITPGAFAAGAQGASFPVLDPNTLEVLSYESDVGMVGLSE